MTSSRTATALVGLVVSLALSVVLWYVFDFALFFLFVPFVPFLLRGHTDGDETSPSVQECPACGFQTRDPSFDYCPRDGTRLAQAADADRR